MKRIIAVLFFAFLLNGCDDGDLISDEIDFADIATDRCETSNRDILYKLNDRDVLILQIPNLDNVLPNVPTPEGTPTTLAINNNTIRLVYRVYNGEPTDNNVCASIQPPAPSIIEEWNAIQGTIEITTVAIKSPNTTEGYEGGEKITALRHAIVIRNVTWQTPANQIIDPTIEFGYYDDEDFIAPALNAYSTEALKCDPNLIYKKDARTSFTIDIDTGLLDTSVLNTPKTGLITQTTNKVTFRRFAEGIDLGAPTFDFCTDYPPLIPAATEVWTADEGVSGLSGIIEVTTTQIGGGFVHSIRIKNATLRRSDNAFSFKIADDLLYGELSED